MRGHCLPSVSDSQLLEAIFYPPVPAAIPTPNFWRQFFTPCSRGDADTQLWEACFYPLFPRRCAGDPIGTQIYTIFRGFLQIAINSKPNYWHMFLRAFSRDQLEANLLAYVFEGLFAGPTRGQFIGQFCSGPWRRGHF